MAALTETILLGHLVAHVWYSFQGAWRGKNIAPAPPGIVCEQTESDSAVTYSEDNEGNNVFSETASMQRSTDLAPLSGHMHRRTFFMHVRYSLEHVHTSSLYRGFALKHSENFMDEFLYSSMHIRIHGIDCLFCSRTGFQVTLLNGYTLAVP